MTGREHEWQPHPLRRQRLRTAGWRMTPGGVYVGRPTKWGNPFCVGPCPLVNGCVLSHTDAARLFASLVASKTLPTHLDHNGLAGLRKSIRRAIKELRGKLLLCWCPITEPCHADVLAEMANE